MWQQLGPGAIWGKSAGLANVGSAEVAAPEFGTPVAARAFSVQRPSLLCAFWATATVHIAMAQVVASPAVGVVAGVAAASAACAAQIGAAAWALSKTRTQPTGLDLGEWLRNDFRGTKGRRNSTRN